MKYFVISIVILCLGLVAWAFLYRDNIINWYDDWQRDQAIIEMPEFEFKTLSGKSFGRKDLSNKKTLLLYFNPLCDHCKEEIEGILGDKEKFNDIQIIMVSPYLKNEILKFDSIYHLRKEENITVLHDEKYKFYEIFNAKAFPTTYIYDSNKKLKLKIRGKIPLKSLLKKL